MALWPDNHLVALRDYLSVNGVSFAQATVSLNRQFRTDYSRNAVIGKATREKIPCKNQQHVHGMAKPKKPRPHRKRHRPPTPPEPVVLRSVEVEPLHISFGQLTSETCKWPYGDAAPFTYCGNHVFSGSYCGAHHFLSKRSNA